MLLRWPRRHAPTGAAPAARYRRSTAVSTATQGGRTVLLDLRSEQYFSLDDVGMRIWEALARETSVEEIVGRLAEVYEAPEERIRADVRVFMDALVRDRLVEASR